MKRSIENFMFGFGSLFDFFPNDKKSKIKRLKSSRNDFYNIQNDWQNVANDIQQSMNKEYELQKKSTPSKSGSKQR